ncbi:hypothetical protein K4K55_006370 [Colletotrichum sp. SAR 10_96]|nr:hypothetical protein K4K55_006370 [Colletotrichum sp. SAR 10_96]
MQLHPRTSTPKASTVLRDFLAQAKCICCTVRVVSLTGSRAVVEWGSVPYFTARGRRAEFVYHTAERAADLRPEVLRTYAGREEMSAEWVRDRLRDSWLVERLVYWAEFLEEWKFYREWYVYRADLFERLPDVFSPGCEGCVKTHRPDGMRRRASSVS